MQYSAEGGSQSNTFYESALTEAYNKGAPGRGHTRLYRGESGAPHKYPKHENLHGGWFTPDPKYALWYATGHRSMHSPKQELRHLDVPTLRLKEFAGPNPAGYEPQYEYFIPSDAQSQFEGAPLGMSINSPRAIHEDMLREAGREVPRGAGREVSMSHWLDVDDKLRRFFLAQWKNKEKKN